MWSSLIWVHSVCPYAKIGLKSLQEYSADDINRRHFQMQMQMPSYRLHSVEPVILVADSGGTDQNVRMCRLIWAFAVRICLKTLFRMAQPLLWLLNGTVSWKHTCILCILHNSRQSVRGIIIIIFFMFHHSS